jgi:hypothetical protein
MQDSMKERKKMLTMLSPMIKIQFLVIDCRYIYFSDRDSFSSLLIVVDEFNS